MKINFEGVIGEKFKSSYKNPNYLALNNMYLDSP